MPHEYGMYGCLVLESSYIKYYQASKVINPTNNKNINIMIIAISCTDYNQKIVLKYKTPK